MEGQGKRGKGEIPVLSISKAEGRREDMRNVREMIVVCLE